MTWSIQYQERGYSNEGFRVSGGQHFEGVAVGECVDEAFNLQTVQPALCPLSRFYIQLASWPQPSAYRCRFSAIACMIGLTVSRRN
jgi:hypothetical protein